MALSHIPVDQISETHLQLLVSAKAGEQRDIEYKRESYKYDERGKREFLADISSFANTVGGDIIIGMEAKSGLPIALLGIDGEAVDAEKLRLEQIAQTGLQPRLRGFRIEPVPLANGKAAIVIRIPRSWNPPHRVIAQNSNRFWARNSGGKYEPDVDELRNLFFVAPDLADRIRDFRSTRLAKISAADAPAALSGDGYLVLHVIPFAALEFGQEVPVAELMQMSQMFRPFGQGSDTPFINIDGLITARGRSRSETGYAYVQVYRSGIIEAVRSNIISQERTGARVVYSDTLETILVGALPSYLAGIRDLGIEPPIAILISLLGLKGVNLNARLPGVDEEERSQFDRDEIHLGEIVLTDPITDDGDVAPRLRPAFDQIFNAAGAIGSPNFDEDGHWRRPSP